MSFNEFWRSVQTAVRLRSAERISDSPRFDQEFLDHVLRQSTLWATPQSVAGFDETDLSFLPEVERKRLAELVASFRKETSMVRPMAPATREVAEAALPFFREIVQRLEFDRYGDPEAYRLGKQIERDLEPRPPELADLRFETALDHTGDPGLWIWAFLTDDVSKNDDIFLEAAQRVEPILDSVARRVDPDRWPYISFRPITESAEALETS